jgi:hypothetical protein
VNARFTEGMRVIAYRHRQEPATRTVVRVTKTTVVLDNGDVYNQSGTLRGGNSLYGEHIEVFTEEEWSHITAKRTEKLRRARAQARKAAVLNFVQYVMTDDEVEELYRQLRNKGMPEVKL